MIADRAPIPIRPGVDRALISRQAAQVARDRANRRVTTAYRNGRIDGWVTGFLVGLAVAVPGGTALSLLLISTVGGR